jgi:lipopolysaccharide cholinephosphotransferase
MSRKLTLEELHNKHLEMLKKFDVFCMEYKLNYFLAYGTLLGAVRHKGFIPWDDDVDILMPRPDYEKLLSFDNISDNMVIVSCKKEQGYYHPFPYINICDTSTAMVEHLLKKPTGKGVFLDVFPLDGCPDNRMLRYIGYLELKILSKAYSLKILSKPNTKGGIRFIIEKIISMVFKNLKEKDLIDKIIQASTRYKYEESEMVWNGVFLIKGKSRNIYPKLIFEKYIMCSFEDTELRIPVGYNDYLCRLYGNYMKLPDIKERTGHHEIDYLWKTDKIALK